MTTKIALLYGHVASNIGDLAINGGTVNLLRAVFPDVNIDVVLLDADASDFLDAAKSSFDGQGGIRFTNLKTHGEKAPLFLRSPKMLFEEAGVADADIVLLGAGEHLFGYQHEENDKTLFWRAFPAYAAKVAGKKCIVLPSTFGPFESERASALFTSLLRLTDAVAARDSRSRQLLKSRYDADTPLLLDPAFFLDFPKPVPQQPQEKYGATALVMRSEGWGIRLSSASRREQTERFKASGYEASKAFSFSLKFATRLLNTTDQTLRVFVQTTADQELAEELGKRLTEFMESGRLTIERPHSVKDYLRRLSQVDRVVSNRFHALILGMLAERPVHGIYFDVHGHKIPGLFDLLEAPGSCINLSQMDPVAAAAEVLSNIARESESEHRRLQARIENLRKDTELWLKDAFLQPASSANPQILLDASVSLGGFADRLFKISVEDSAKKQVELTKKTLKIKEEGWGAERKQREEKQEEIASDLAQADSERDRLRGELIAAGAERKQLEVKLAQQAGASLVAVEEMKSLKAEAQAKEEGWGAERKQREEKQEEIASDLAQADSERDRLRGELIAARAENQRLIAANLSQFQSLQLELPNSLSNKLGRALLDGIHSPSAAVRLPYKLYKFWRNTKQQLPPESLGGESFSSVIAAYADGGFDGVDALFASMEVSATIKANGFTALARHLKKDADAQQAVEAARRAYLADPKPFRRKWLAFRLNEAGQVLDAEALFEALPSWIKFSESEENRVQAIRILGNNKRCDEVRSQLTDKAHRTQGGLPAHAKPDSMFQKFWDFLQKQDASAAYSEYKRLKEVGLRGSLTLEQQAEFKKVSRERVCRLGLLELADTKPISSATVQTVRRVCYILHNSLPHSSGGYATRAHGIARGLQANGWEVLALARPGYPLDMIPDMSADCLDPEVCIDGVRYLFTREPLKRGSKSNKRGLNTDEYIVAAADILVERFKSLKPSLIIAASNYLTALPALIAARKLGLPFIYEVRGFWEITSMSRRPDYAETIPYLVEQLMEAGVASRADHVFTLTEPMNEELVQRGVTPSKISLLPNSCETSEFLPRERDPNLTKKHQIPTDVLVIGYIGTFVDYEGLEDLATACGRLAKEGTEFRLLLVGNENVSGIGLGPIGQAIQSIASEYGYFDWLIMPGRVPQHEVAAYYSLIDIAPFPRKPWSVCEMVSPLKPLEAMAMEKAVLASDVRALSEMIKQNETGLLFRKGDIASLEEQLKRLINDRGLRQNLGKAGRKWVVEERTWNLTCMRAAEVIARLFSRRREELNKCGKELSASEELDNYRVLLAQAKEANPSVGKRTDSTNRIVYFLHGSFPYQSGGYATRTDGVVRSVLEAGYEILPYTRPSFPSDLKEMSGRTDFPLENQVDGVTYRRIFAAANRNDYSEPDYMLGCIEPFEDVLRRERPAVVHCRSTYLIAVPALIAARRVGLPFVYEVSGLWELVYEARNSKGQHTETINRMKMLETFVIREADALITLTDQMKEELIQRGAKPESIFMAPNSVDVARCMPRPVDNALKAKLGIDLADNVVGYIGTIVDYEGLDDLVQASARLIESGVRLKVLIVGSGSGPAQEKVLKGLIDRLGMNTHVIMTGRVPSETVSSYYSICDVMAYPRKPWTVCETVSPMKLFEAMAQKKAVLVSDVKALRDIVQGGRIGRLFEKGNLDSLVDNLGALLAAPDERQRLGQAARDWVGANSSWGAAGKEIVRAYQHALGLAPEGRIQRRSQSVTPSTPLSAVQSKNNGRSQAYPVWWPSVPVKFREHAGFIDVTAWNLSDSVKDLKQEYESRFDPEVVAKRVPLINWQRADICSQLITSVQPWNVLDIGSAHGEFVNLFAGTNPNVPIASVDLKDYSLWFDRTGRVERIYKSIFDLDANAARDVVTCFEVIEHLPPERVEEAVGLLRSLAKRKLFLSVPFMEPLPLYKGHFTRFDETNLLSLFPDAKFTVYGKGGKSSKKVHAWIMCEIDCVGS